MMPTSAFDLPKIEEKIVVWKGSIFCTEHFKTSKINNNIASNSYKHFVPKDRAAYVIIKNKLQCCQSSSNCLLPQTKIVQKKSSATIPLIVIEVQQNIRSGFTYLWILINGWEPLYHLFIVLNCKNWRCHIFCKAIQIINYRLGSFH